MAYLYSISLFIVLCLYAFLITIQIYRCLKTEIFFQQLKVIGEQINDIDQLFNLLQIFSKKKLWLDSIFLIENQKNLPSEMEYKYMNILGFIYEKMERNDLAQFYYHRSLSIKPDYTPALNNLAKFSNKK